MASSFKKGVEYDSKGGVSGCVFCRISSRTEKDGASLLFEDDRVVVFVPKKPSATQHVLSVPKAHIKNTDDLTSDHVPLMEHMRECGLQVLRKRSPGVDESKLLFVFHVPPFNSIDHLHLHCFVRPFVPPPNLKGSFHTPSTVKYMPFFPWCMSFGVALKRAMATPSPPVLD